MLLDCMECADNGVYFEPPISPYGIARMFDSTAYHQSPLVFKRNVITSCYIPHPLLSRQEMSAWVLDYLVFGNNYMEVRRNMLGEPIALKHAQAKYTRRGSDLKKDQYWFITRRDADYPFKPGSICQIKNPSIPPGSTAHLNTWPRYKAPCSTVKRPCSAVTTTSTAVTPG
jgi:hypothetical protein